MVQMETNLHSAASVQGDLVGTFVKKFEQKVANKAERLAGWLQ
jgi:hypothetical protein